MHDSPDSTPSLGSRVSGIESRLRTVRARARTLLIASGLASVATIVIGSLVLAAFLDYLVRSPDWLRLALWIAGALGLVWLVRRHVRPAWGFRPDLSQVALRLERSDAGRAAGLEGLLTSGLELAKELDAAPGPATTRALGTSVVARAVDSFAGVRAGALLDLRGARRHVLAMLACVAGAVGIIAAVGPTPTRTALTRLLAPWAGAQWPKRTEIVDATRLTVHPLGAAIPLRAALTHSDRPEGQARITASYRVVTDGTPGPTRQVLLTGQRRTISLPDEGRAPISGELYERLIDAEVAVAPGVHSLEYWLTSDDDATPRTRVLLVEPPAVVAASATITPPEYARPLLSSEGARFASGQRELGTGTDQRAVVGPILAGSSVELTIAFNKPVRSPGEVDREALARFLNQVFRGADLGTIERASFTPAAWTIVFSPRASLRLPVYASDEHGLATREEGAFSFDLAEDKPPSVSVMEPREDESVLPGASIGVTGEARDDVGIGSLVLTRQRATPPAGTTSKVPELTGDPETFASLPEGAPQPGARSVHATLELAGLDLKPGDEVWLHAIAQDTYAARTDSGEARHDPVRSSPRKLRIIREEELVAQIRQELSGVRKAALRLDAEQGDLRKSVDQGAVTSEERRRQAGLTQRLSQQREVVDRLSQRTERNRLSDQTLKDLLGELSSSFDAAASPSERAAGQMDQQARAQAPAGQPEAERAELPERERASIAKDQDAVREQLARVAELLDKGEDSWLVGRTLQKLLDQQRSLQSQTRRAAERSQGKRPADLTPQERGLLEQLADQQRRLAEQARSALDQLSQRSKQMQSVDTAQSQAMKQAEQRGRQQQLEQKMSEAARNVEKNQTSSADAQQQEATNALEQMLQDLNNAQKNRDAALRRILASLIESLQRLVADQESQLAALDKGIEGGALDGLAPPLIALNRATLGAAEQARGDKAFAALAKIIELAADAQGKGVSALRAAPVDAKLAQEQERESLRQLRLALEQAQRLQQKQQQNEQDQKRQQLRAIYRELLETQVALKGEVDPFTGKPLERRDRIALRALGERQEQIQKKLAETRAMSQDMQDAGVIQLAHDRLDAATGVAAKKLKNGSADASVARNQDSAIRVLKALVEALDDRAKDNDEFQDESQGGGGGQNGQGQKPPLVPPLAELRLLRSMQQEIGERTRATDESPDADELRRLGDDQQKLFDRGNELIEKLKKQQGGPETPKEPKGD